MLITLLLLLVVGSVKETKQLNLGRDAQTGEFPFLVRILIFEGQHNDHDGNDGDHGRDYEIDDEHHHGSHESNDDRNSDSDAHQHSYDHGVWHRFCDRGGCEKGGSFECGGVVAAGVLITTSRVLTTCDSVGFFTGHIVTPYDLQHVNVMAGSIRNTGEGGQFRTPSSSNAHPNCYFSTTVLNVLFNYGVYEFNKSFDDLVHPETGVPLIQPIQTEFKDKDDMANSLLNLKFNEVECSVAAWGNKKKEFEGRGMPDHFQRFAPILQTTKMEVVHYPECIESTCVDFDQCHLNIWESGMVCAKAEEGGPCNEDRAAPLICGGEVFGIHVNTLRCTTRGLPRHFLRIDLAFDYVFDTMNQGKAATFGKAMGPILIGLSLQVMKPLA